MPRGYFEDLTGRTFERLTVIERAANIGSRTRWKCRCSCGVFVIVDGTDLKRGHTKSCGCYIKEIRGELRTINLTGKTFGRLSVIARDKNIGRCPTWRCRCSCGKIVIIRGASLRDGASQSCGCLRLELQQKDVKDITGLHFGNLLAIGRNAKRNAHNDVMWDCVCDCGKHVIRTASYLEMSLRKGFDATCGCGRKKLKLIGMRFGRLVVIERLLDVPPEGKCWRCQCDCGKIIDTYSTGLRNGGTGSCGCVHEEIIHRKGADNHAWKGGRRMEKGYVIVRHTGHTRRKDGYVREHVLVMEKHLGRHLAPKETVHHKNGDRKDNRLENLELWSHNHPCGQRVEDKVAFCLEMEDRYPEIFAEQRKTKEEKKKKEVEEQTAYLDFDVESSFQVYR